MFSFSAFKDSICLFFFSSSSYSDAILSVFAEFSFSSDLIVLMHPMSLSSKDLYFSISIPPGTVDSLYDA
jgi:hypothetical protein